MRNSANGLLNTAASMLALIVRYRRVLVAVTRVELAKRYSGSVLGPLWVFLYPALLLGVYLFVYLVVFKMRFPGYSEMDYVLYVFCGLVPYVGFMEAVNAGCMCIKQNMHLVRNVMLPIELVPVRAVATSLPSQLVSIAVVIVLLAANGSLSWNMFALPVVVALQILFLMGLAFVLSGLAVALPDITWFVSLGLLLLMFVSPIGFKPDMLPAGFRLMADANPVYYMIEAFRATMIGGYRPAPWVFPTYTLMCIGTFALGALFFVRFKNVLVDNE